MDAPNQQPPIADLLPRGIGVQKRPDLSSIERRQIVSFFLERCSDVDGVRKPARGTKVAAANFFFDRTTAAKIWKTASDNYNNPEVGYFTAPPKQGKCGKKAIFDLDVLEMIVAELPREHRKSIRRTASTLGVSSSTIQKMLKERNLRRSSNSLKVFLTENNKWMRLEYAVAQIARRNTCQQH
jgi:hypothetical protein